MADDWNSERYLLKPEPGEPDAEPMVVTNAEGATLTLADGTEILDFHSQYGCIGLGHRHPKMVAALQKAVTEGVGYVNDHFSNPDRNRAAERLIGTTTSNGDESWAGAVRFATSGSEAVELALLIARVVKDRPVVVTQDLCYHGWTAGAASATTVPMLRNGFIDGETGRMRQVASPHPPYPTAPSPICSRCPLAKSYPSCKDENGILGCVNATEAAFRAIGPTQIAAFITELFIGVAMLTPPPEYAEQIRELTQRLDILWIDDEVFSGAGRTGQWWAYQLGDATPDLLCAAKGLTSSTVPTGAVLVSKEIAEFFTGGIWLHGATFSGHPLAMAAVAAQVEIMEEEGILEKVRQSGAYLEGRLGELKAAHPSIGGYSGSGLGWMLELVKDSETGELWVPSDRWFDPTFDGAETFWPSNFLFEECLNAGVYVIPFSPNCLTILPPLTITEAEIDRGLEALDAALTQLDEKARAELAPTAA